MVFRRFHINVTVRVVLLGLTLVLLAYLIFRSELTATPLIVGAAAAFQLIALLHFVDKTNRDLARILLSIRHADFTQSFTREQAGSSFEELNSAFAQVMEEFRRIRAEKEAHYRYLQTVVQHVGIGLIAFSSDGEVALVNNAARKLLRIRGPFKRLQLLCDLSPALVDALLSLRSGDKTLVKVQDGEDLMQLAIYATEFSIQGKAYTLVSVQDIQNELEEKEMEAWQRLTRVLTHEIMNSVTPIASLASTVNVLLEDAADTEPMRDARGALRTIEKRSQGLIHFVDAYRNFTRIPPPNFQIFQVKDLFERVGRLLTAQLSSRACSIEMLVEPETLELTADPDLTEQVLINLLLNAMQALEGRADARIALRASHDERGRVLIQVSDNGPGIVPEALDKIFVPFFTTKKNGSGIGLSLSRQILRLHKGTLSVRSDPGSATVFTMRF